MKFLAILFAVHFIVQGLAETSIQTPESAREFDVARIIEGWPAAPNQFPHQVNLRMVTATSTLNGCGGSLISQSWVLTAAHCLVSKTFVFVRLGNVNVTTPGLILETNHFFAHPKYNPQTLADDVGLVELNRVVHITDSIRPIRLPRLSQVEETFSDKVVTISGWGYTTNNGPVSEVLRYVNLTTISNKKCQESYQPSLIINSTICAVGLLTDSQGTCNGDSGGPLIIREDDGEITQIGVVSFVSNVGCSSKFPSGYVRTASFLEWIGFNSDLVLRP